MPFCLSSENPDITPSFIQTQHRWLCRTTNWKEGSFQPVQESVLFFTKLSTHRLLLNTYRAHQMSQQITPVEVLLHAWSQTDVRFASGWMTKKIKSWDVLNPKKPKRSWQAIHLCHSDQEHTGETARWKIIHWDKSNTIWNSGPHHQNSNNSTESSAICSRSTGYFSQPTMCFWHQAPKSSPQHQDTLFLKQHWWPLWPFFTNSLVALASRGERTLRQLAGSRRSSVFREFCKETQRCCQLQHLAQDDAFPNRKRAGKTEECIHSTGWLRAWKLIERERTNFVRKRKAQLCKALMLMFFRAAWIYMAKHKECTVAFVIFQELQQGG